MNHLTIYLSTLLLAATVFAAMASPAKAAAALHLQASPARDRLVQAADDHHHHHRRHHHHHH